MKPRQFWSAEKEMGLASCPNASFKHLENEQYFTNFICTFSGLM
jgi:hypothetical protein